MDRPIDIYNDYRWLFRAEPGQWCNNDGCCFINTMDQQHIINSIKLLDRTEQDLRFRPNITESDKELIRARIKSKKAELQAAITT